MSDINRMELFGKLDATLYRTLEGATSFCRLRGHTHVELVHWLHQLLHADAADLQCIARYFEMDEAALQRGLIAALERLPRGSGSVADLSEHIDAAVERGWMYGSLKFGAERIRGGHLLLGLLKTASLRGVLYGISGEFQKILPDVLLSEYAAITDGSTEAAESMPTVAGVSAGGGAGGSDVLANYATDLTARAREGAIDPVAGRDEEIRQIIDILMRRRQNNPLLAGEAGVGKTAVVEGLALRLARGDVPPALRGVRLLLLDIGLLQAGAGVKGEFEQRLRQVVDAVQASETPIVLFIDEIHTLVGAGGTAGTGDAANLLKPALARGQLRTIGATTWAEYKRHIEKDPALTRRFQPIQISEPRPDEAVVMLRSLAGTLEGHHGVLLLDEAIDAAVRLSYRYIPARQLPDKAVALLDTACARVAVSQHATPGPVEDARRRIESLDIEHGIMQREARLCLERGERLQACAAGRQAAERELAALESAWEEERTLAARLRALREQVAATGLEASSAAQSPIPMAASGGVDEHDEAGRESLDDARRELAEVQARLAALQAESALVFPAVDSACVAAVVAEWTGIPVGRMVRDEADTVLRLGELLERRVVGQRHALDLIAQRIQSSRARLTDPEKPVGVFMLCGPSGVGKTETALALAETLYGGEQNLIVINMSEFQEAHTVSTLKGAPPGYVGYGEGGVLTEAVRRRPHSVVLLDEVEKAHRDVHELFFQVFDKGWMEDGEGRAIDFRHTVILLTSNIGTREISMMCRHPDNVPTPQRLGEVLRQPLLEAFPPALLGRLAVVPYYPLPDAMLARIVAMHMARLVDRLRDHHGIELKVDESATALIVERCVEVESGARMIEAIVVNNVLPRISRRVLDAALAEGALKRIALSARGGEFSYEFD
ncbi:type VI secretion system ATPase TssH [Pusillimonas noertemannii]|uniref:type VI secretion system ATPase TssH n=1 Tax=Pusillimonas noertemannii TaxID=305977 RepID=UPI000307F24F|nr:type VI secretion system ATPase TssH [Pusillimonas noertemannii]